MKDRIFAMVCAGGGVVYAHLGALSLHLKILVGLMALDYVVGVVMAFALKSKKGRDGFRSTHATNGFLRKCMCLVMVIVGYVVDVLAGSSFVSDTVIMILIANECLSLVEHAVIVGVPGTSFLRRVIAAYKDTIGGETEKGGEKSNE